MTLVFFVVVGNHLFNCSIIIIVNFEHNFTCYMVGSIPAYKIDPNTISILWASPL